jgi:DNA-binding NtrC family response regulator
MSEGDRREATWVTYAAGRPTGVRIRRCRLEVLTGADAGMVQVIDAAHIRIGARPGNDVQLSDAKVSGWHCEIQLGEHGYRLRDLDSTNGTFVGSSRIVDAYIAPGTIIGLGATRLRFEPLDESVERPLSAEDRFGEIIGRSVKMRELFAWLGRLAPSDTTVLITGETGVGKELVARSLHQFSSRSSGPFEVLDCGAVPQNLIEDYLFGHERGAFTGATSAFAGVFERAGKGTVFLDEIGELPLDMQPKLLRVLERHEVRRIGGARTIPVDIRVVAATNRDLGVEVNRGRFRADLYYRLAVARVHVPPLRERRDDIPLLVEHILAEIEGGEHAHLAPDTVERLKRLDWPGNVRQLQNALRRAIVLHQTQVGEALPATETPAADHSGPGGGVESSEQPGSGDLVLTMTIDTSRPYKSAKQEVITEFERRYIGRLVREHEGNISQAARAAGLDRMSLHKILKRLGQGKPGP